MTTYYFFFEKNLTAKTIAHPVTRELSRVSLHSLVDLVIFSYTLRLFQLHLVIYDLVGLVTSSYMGLFLGARRNFDNGGVQSVRQNEQQPEFGLRWNFQESAKN